MRNGIGIRYDQWSGMGNRSALLCALVADDLTGACDAAAQFTRYGYSASAALDWTVIEDCQSDVIAATTDSRVLAPDEAAGKVTALVGLLRGRPSRLVFKKVDSVLRGNLGVEIRASLEAFGCDVCVMAPSFPSQGRTISGGWLKTTGTGAMPPVHLPTLLTKQGVTALAHLDQASRAGGPGSLAARIRDAHAKGTRYFTFDAESDSDLEWVIAAANAVERRILWVGSAGLACQLARHAAESDGARLPRRNPPAAAALSAGEIVLAIGSDHPATLEQMKILAARRPVRTACPAPAELSGAMTALRNRRSLILQIDPRATSREALREFLSGLLGAPIRGLVLSGGDTASLVCSAVEAGSIRLEGEIVTGIPWGRIGSGMARGLPVATKSGGFGSADALAETVDFLGRCRKDPEV